MVIRVYEYEKLLFRIAVEKSLDFVHCAICELAGHPTSGIRKLYLKDDAGMSLLLGPKIQLGNLATQLLRFFSVPSCDCGFADKCEQSRDRRQPPDSRCPRVFVIHVGREEVRNCRSCSERPFGGTKKRYPPFFGEYRGKEFHDEAVANRADDIGRRDIRGRFSARSDQANTETLGR